MDKSKLRHMYEIMQRQRLFFNEEIKQHKRGNISGFLHLYNGEEAIAAGVSEDLTENDTVFSTHRPEGHLIAMGVPFLDIMAECYGRTAGSIQGLGGSMHLSAPDKGIPFTNGVVGGGIGLAVGAALAHKYKNNNSVAVAYFGDGASNQGVLYEGMNLASIWKLPVIFVMENNGYAVSTKASESLSVENVADRAAGFNLPGYTIDGNNVFEVFETASEAIKRARSGEGPTFIECKTNRLRGHNETDQQWYYRTKEEVKFWKDEKCPITKTKKYLIEKGWITEDEDAELVISIKKEVEESSRLSAESSVPDISLVDRLVWKED